MPRQEIVRRMFNAIPEAEAGLLHQRLKNWRTANDPRTRKLIRNALARAGFAG